ncbi:MAG: hypothetical protein ABJB16_10005 [Saprospiraceae bacterium]
MTSLSGNICLALAALISVALLSPFFQHKISTSNDQGASGYMVIIVIFLSLLFLGLMSIVYIAINRQGGFTWISNNGTLRFLFLSIGLLSAVIIAAIGIMNRFMPVSSSDVLQSLMKAVPVVIFVVLLVTGFILNNNAIREHVNLLFYKWPLFLVDGLSLVGVLFLAATTLFSGTSSLEDSTRNYESAPSIKNSRLAEIEESDVKENKMRLFEFTGGLYPQEVRDKASAKIKTNPDWEKEIIDMLENDQALEAFNFLQSNDVTDKKSFLQPVFNGVMSVAAYIRHTIQGTSPSAFDDSMFSDEVNRVLRTVEKFEGNGVDYLPAVREIRDALDEPVLGKKINFDCRTILDSWIGKH